MRGQRVELPRGAARRHRLIADGCHFGCGEGCGVCGLPLCGGGFEARWLCDDVWVAAARVRKRSNGSARSVSGATTVPRGKIRSADVDWWKHLSSCPIAYHPEAGRKAALFPPPSSNSKQTQVATMASLTAQLVGLAPTATAAPARVGNTTSVAFSPRPMQASVVRLPRGARARNVARAASSNDYASSAPASVPSRRQVGIVTFCPQ